MKKTAEMAMNVGVIAAGFALSLIEKNAPRATCLFYKHKDLCEYPETCIYKCSTDTADLIFKVADLSTYTDSFVDANTETKSQGRRKYHAQL